MRISLKSLVFAAGATALVLAPTAASALNITFTLTPDHTTAIQQTTQDPCVFGNAPCGQNNDSIGAQFGLGHDFPWDRTPGSSEDNGSGGPLVTGDLVDDLTWGNGGGEQNDYDLSRIFVHDLELATASDRFTIGIDVNQAADKAGVYTLEQFVMQIWNNLGTVLLAEWTYTGPTQIPASNNGTGWSDAILSFDGLDLDNYADNAFVLFKTTWSGNTDGEDNYFIRSTIPGPPNIVPEPASILLLGSGLMGAAGMVRRRRAAKK